MFTIKFTRRNLLTVYSFSYNKEYSLISQVHRQWLTYKTYIFSDHFITVRQKIKVYRFLHPVGEEFQVKSLISHII